MRFYKRDKGWIVTLELRRLKTTTTSMPRRTHFLVLAASLVACSLAAQEARLSSMSIRAQAGGSDNLITGFRFNNSARRCL
jgi:hypothetical protein